MKMKEIDPGVILAQERSLVWRTPRMVYLPGKKKEKEIIIKSSVFVQLEDALQKFPENQATYYVNSYLMGLILQLN